MAIGGHSFFGRHFVHVRGMTMALESVFANDLQFGEGVDPNQAQDDERLSIYSSQNTHSPPEKKKSNISIAQLRRTIIFNWFPVISL